MTPLTPEILNLVFASAGGLLVHLWHRNKATPPAAPVLPSLTPAAPVAPGAAPSLPQEFLAVVQLMQELKAKQAHDQAHQTLQELAVYADKQRAAQPALPVNFHLPK